MKAVILTHIVDAQQQHQVAQVLHEAAGLDWQQVQAAACRAPGAIFTGVDADVVGRIVRDLSSLGFDVKVVESDSNAMPANSSSTPAKTVPDALRGAQSGDRGTRLTRRTRAFSVALLIFIVLGLATYRQISYRRPAANNSEVTVSKIAPDAVTLGTEGIQQWTVAEFREFVDRLYSNRTQIALTDLSYEEGRALHMADLAVMEWARRYPADVHVPPYLYRTGAIIRHIWDRGGRSPMAADVFNYLVAHHPTSQEASWARLELTEMGY